MEVSFLRSAFRESHYPPPDKPEVAVAGRSNVGKSSLINVLVRRKKLAKTGSKPGRTQAINFFCVDGRFYLVDLPGYGYARVPIEIKKSWGKMVETYLRKRPNLKGVVVILDIRREPNPGDMNLLSWLNHYQLESIVVLTKADKLSRQQSRVRAKSIYSQLEKFCGAYRPTVFSAKTKEGRAEILEKINRLTECSNS